MLTSHSENNAGNCPAQIDVKVLEGALMRKQFASEFTITDFKESRHQQLAISVSTPSIVPSNGVQSHEITVLEASNPTPVASAIAAQLAIELRSQCFEPRMVRWNSIGEENVGNDCVSLVELDTPLFENIDEEDFIKAKNIISQAPSLLWVTSLESPAEALSFGMARSIRNEMAAKRFRTLSIQRNSKESPDRVAQLLTRLITSSTPDSEFVEVNGVLQICRVVEDKSTEEDLARMMAEERERIESIPLEEAQGPQKLAIKAQGMLDSICLEPDDSQGRLADDEVLIEVKATGLK